MRICFFWPSKKSSYLIWNQEGSMKIVDTRDLGYYMSLVDKAATGFQRIEVLLWVKCCQTSLHPAENCSQSTADFIV